MNFTFLKSGSVAFFRSDAEQAEWTQEEMSLFCTFPVDPKKTIEHGMTVLFQDPATGDWQAYEIRNCSTYTAEGYQQFTAEDICIAELTDCHIADDLEPDNVSASSILSQILSGTGWSVGNVGSDPTSSGNIGRGSVWQGVSTIRNNWNVNILSRVTVNSSGIVGRYLDIVSTGGTWRGLRLSIDKNCNDPCVTYDDSELYTALYGYGASYTEGESVYEQQTVETNFAGVAWSATADHPAKPAGQKYLEWPEKTALYGRNGRKRFGYYQNTEIKDPNVLLQKTWETLKVVSDPKLSISGTVTDLKRIGYADEPLRLHDMAQVDLNGVLFYKQVIQLTVNLLDPTGNRVNIGSYIPNIIYINRETEDYATGGSTGAGGRSGGGGSRSQKKQGEFETSILQNERNILLEARQVDENRDILRQAGMQIDPITGVLIYAEDTQNMIGSKFRVQSNQIQSEVEQRLASDNLLSSRITQNANSISLEVSERKGADDQLSSRITVTAREIEQKVTDSETRMTGRISVQAGRIDQIVTSVGSNGQVTAASICLAINNGGSSATINADKIYLLGQTIANTITADYISTKVSSLSYVSVKSLSVQAGGSVSWAGNGASITDSIAADLIKNLQITLSGNTYKLQKVTVGDASWQDVGSFSRAVSSWSVGGGSGKVSVTANPQNQSKSVPVSISGANGIYSNGSYTYKVMYENASGDDVETGAEKTVTVSISTPTPSNARVSSSSSGSSIGTLSGASPGKYILFNVGSSVYNIFLV